MKANLDDCDLLISDVMFLPEESARFLRISEEELYESACLGKIPGVCISGQWRFSKRQIIEYCLRPLEDRTTDAYRRYIYHRYYRPDWSIESVERKMVSLREASEAIELSEETILQDMGQGVIHGFYQDCDWFFDYIDLCVYHHHYYMPEPDASGAYQEPCIPIFKAQDIIQSYNLGQRDFSALSIENQADFRGCDLSGIDLSTCTLLEANFEGSNLEDADLRNADLGCANFQNSNLRGTALSGAQLYWANLCGADLRGAWLYEAHLEYIQMNELTVINNTWLWPKISISRDKWWKYNIRTLQKKVILLFFPVNLMKIIMLKIISLFRTSLS